MAVQASTLADLPPRTEAHSSAEIRRAYTQLGPPGGSSFLPHDKLPRGRKVFKYALTVVDIASRYKEAEPLTSKNSNEVALAFKRIYKRSPLKWPQLLQVDPGREFMGAVTKEMENHKTYIRHGRVDIHRDQAIVEHFNRTLAESLFGHR